MKFLIVEDDKKIARALGIRIRAAGYEPIAAFDAVQGTQLAVQHRPDLVLLDISMPGGDGFKVADRLQSSVLTAGTPMIFLTAGKQPGLREKAMEVGASAFFEKPYEAEELLAAIREALGESDHEPSHPVALNR